MNKNNLHIIKLDIGDNLAKIITSITNNREKRWALEKIFNNINIYINKEGKNEQ